MGKLQKPERASVSIQDLCQRFSEEALGFAGGTRITWELPQTTLASSFPQTLRDGSRLAASPFKITDLGC